MLIEVKVKVSRIEELKTKKLTETYILDREFFSQAEYTVTEKLNEEMESHLIDDFYIVSLRQSSIKEIDEQSLDDTKPSFTVTLKDIFLADDGTEKKLKYKVLIWGNDLTEANRRALELSHQGYDMLIEGIKQVDYIYITESDTGETESVES